MATKTQERASRRRRRGHGAVEAEDNEERWLLTYADMITLLMALFMVLFSISSVNVSKFESLSKALNEAFSGRILPGGPALQEHAADGAEQPAPEPPIPAIQPLVDKFEADAAKSSAQTEQDSLEALKREIDRYAREHGLRRRVETHIAQRGLVIRLLTDRVLFDSGQAELKAQATPLLAEIGRLLRAKDGRAVAVEGHTDNVPIRGSVFPTNWELSTARASRVVRFLVARGVESGRLSATGYAALHPIASNATAAGRSRNRRVEVVLHRSSHGGRGADRHGGQ